MDKTHISLIFFPPHPPPPPLHILFSSFLASLPLPFHRPPSLFFLPPSPPPPPPLLFFPSPSLFLLCPFLPPTSFAPLFATTIRDVDLASMIVADLYRFGLCPSFAFFYLFKIMLLCYCIGLWYVVSINCSSLFLLFLFPLPKSNG